MVSCGEKVLIWDTDTWQRLFGSRLPIQEVGFMKFSPEGNNLITSDAHGLRVWRAPSFGEIANREARLGRWR